MRIYMYTSQTESHDLPKNATATYRNDPQLLLAEFVNIQYYGNAQETRFL
jgi:hypothetical protein